MTREEIENSKAYQVSKAALEYYNEHHQDNDINLIDAFEAGAEWADKTMIEKACDWIQMNATKYMNSIGGCMYFDVINSTKDFRKAMEL